MDNIRQEICRLCREQRDTGKLPSRLVISRGDVKSLIEVHSNEKDFVALMRYFLETGDEVPILGLKAVLGQGMAVY